jgi:hypothetical protein
MNNRKKMFFKTQNAANIFDNFQAIYALVDIFGIWTNAVFLIRRSSDNATAYVFFDGSGAISLTSLISTTSDTTPDATTLGTWAGSNNCFVRTWYSQFKTNIIGHTIDQNLNANFQPRLLLAGVVTTDGGLPAVDWNVGTYMRGTSLSAFDGFPVTWFGIGSVGASNGRGCLFVSSGDTLDRSSVFIDRSSSTDIWFTDTDVGASYFADLLAQQNSGNRRLIGGSINVSGNMDGYFNGTIQNTNTVLGTMRNITLDVGAVQTSLTQLRGYVQFIGISPEDLSGDMATYNNYINTIYSIY